MFDAIRRLFFRQTNAARLLQEAKDEIAEAVEKCGYAFILEDDIYFYAGMDVLCAESAIVVAKYNITDKHGVKTTKRFSVSGLNALETHRFIHKEMSRLPSGQEFFRRVTRGKNG